jgi:serine/threonine protein phosphatase PrpC
MHEIKDTARALVRIGYDGRVHKTFRGPAAQERFENEVRVLRHLEDRGCDFVPRLLAVEPGNLKIITTNCGSRVDQLDPERMKELFAELAPFGVRHDDALMRNVTYRTSDGRFCIIDFEFATLLEEHARRASRLAWSGMTHRGRFRADNEDNFLALTFEGHQVRYLGKTGESPLTADFIFAVSDGMGGARSGEFASRIAVEKITQVMPRGFGLAASGDPAEFKGLVTGLFEAIHRELTTMGRSYEECAGMGTTLSLCWFTHGRMYLGHVGDSRIYHRPAGGGLVQLSEDHSHVGWLRRSGQLNEREARSHPRRHALHQALGAEHQFVEPQVGAVDCRPGDRFLICSDGLVDGLWDRRIGEVLETEPAGRDIAGLLVTEAIEASGRDNATAVVIEALP